MKCAESGRRRDYEELIQAISLLGGRTRERDLSKSLGLESPNGLKNPPQLDRSHLLLVADLPLARFVQLAYHADCPCGMAHRHSLNSTCFLQNGKDSSPSAQV